MYIEQLYTGGLSIYSYYIESEGLAAVVDPVRDVSAYLEIAKSRNATIKYVFETHFHADFISGHLELHNQTGAKIIYGPNAFPQYDFYAGADNEEFQLGAIALKLLHTPGHTIESSSYLLFDERHNPHSVFTGDTLFVDEVGRPDLLLGSSHTKDEMAAMLFESIHLKLLKLPDYVNIYPAHGSGSACGKAIGSAPHSTIGKQKKSNYALNATTKTEFVNCVLEGLSSPPKYFSRVSKINRSGYRLLKDIFSNSSKFYSVNALMNLIQNRNTLIIDCRNVADFSESFIPGSISISKEGLFANAAATILNPDKELIVVLNDKNKEEILIQLATVGLENVVGFLNGGINEWINSNNKVSKIDCISAENFAERFRYNSCNVIDIRNPDEWVPGFVAGAKLISLGDLESKLTELDPNKTCYVYCSKGIRSMTAASILKRNGFTSVYNVSGGMNKIRKTEISIRQLASFAS